MLAAASPISGQPLETIKLVLLLETRGEEYPETLKKYFRNVLAQTLDLLRDPAGSAQTALPDAVSLAVKLSTNNVLRSAIEEIAKEDDIASAIAQNALSNLEADCDANRQSAHFSREIYAAI